MGKPMPVSRVLVKVLRHSAKSVGLRMDDEGFIIIKELLDHHLFKELDHESLMDIVASDQKSRFEVKDNKIRASQGHSIPLEVSYPVYSDTTKPLFHGTFKDKLMDIQKLGLSKMNRNYIHLTNDLNAVSGIRSTCEVLVYINIGLAISDGIVFYQSSNGVILTRGINGILDPKYFTHITSRDIQSSELRIH